MLSITFQINLETVNLYGHKTPYNFSDAATFATHRVSFFPDLLLNNRELRRGVQFTETGERALYLKNKFTTGDFAFLDVVSESFVTTTVPDINRVGNVAFARFAGGGRGTLSGAATAVKTP